MNAVHVRDQRHEQTPPRNRGDSFSAEEYRVQTRQAVTRLRDKPVTQQDALLKSEYQPRLPAWAGPVVSVRDIPFVILFKQFIEALEQPRQNPPAQAGRAIVPPDNRQQPVRTVRDYLAEDLEGLNPAVTIPEFEVEHFELKPVMFNMLNTLGQFGGSPAKNARQNLKSFLEICNSFKIHGVSNDVLKLKLFPYSLTNKAKAWLNNLPPGSLRSWTDLCRSFLSKFSYSNMTDHLRNQITSFRQEDDEAMHEAWEHYRDAAQCMDCQSGLKY
ncbi:hypothetical protein V6N12_050392 [Hibiscus sabdariffa]|uniref:Retrotransposon gag domain-containing protein n=1 Tax=Hibiscus sabdariffa TaxID=183260 RepID=A0ABR2GCB3_9ROSI